MKLFKTNLVLVILIALAITLSGCVGSQVNSVSVTDDDAPSKVEREKSENNDESTEDEVIEEINEAEENEPIDEPVEDVEPPVFAVGEIAEVPNQYNIVIIGAYETDDRNQFSDKEVSQVIIIDYIYENLGLEDDLSVSEWNFKFVDEGGNMCDTYPVSGCYNGKPTPQGARSAASVAICTVEESETIRVLYYPNMFDNVYACEFNLNINESVEMDFETHSQPVYDNMFEVGEIIEVDTDKGKYTVCIDSVIKTDDRNQFDDSNPKAVYIIEYTYSNIDYSESLTIYDMNFQAIDGFGNMMDSYPASKSKYPQDTINGTRCTAQMAFGALADGEGIILAYYDNMFSESPDFYINVELSND